jgi:hypothetical protein
MTEILLLSLHFPAPSLPSRFNSLSA